MYNTKKLLRDSQNVPIPQYYDPATDSYQPLTGTQNVQLTGSNVDENGRLKTVVEGGTFQATLADQMAKTIDVNLQDAATATGNGTVFAVGAYKTLTFEISGTSTSRTIVFEGASASGAYYAIQGVKLQDLSMATQTTGNGEVWSFEVTGLTSFRARVSAVAGGNVTVKGKAVA